MERAESLRLHERKVALLAEQASQLPEHVGQSLGAGYLTGAAVSIGSIGRECLAVGMSWHMLHGNDREPPAAEPIHVPSLTTPAMDRAVELARELLRQRGWTDEKIEIELNKPPGTGFHGL